MSGKCKYEGENLLFPGLQCNKTTGNAYTLKGGLCRGSQKFQGSNKKALKSIHETKPKQTFWSGWRTMSLIFWSVDYLTLTLVLYVGLRNWAEPPISTSWFNVVMIVALTLTMTMMITVMMDPPMMVAFFLNIDNKRVRSNVTPYIRRKFGNFPGSSQLCWVEM